MEVDEWVVCMMEILKDYYHLKYWFRAIDVDRFYRLKSNSDVLKYLNYFFLENSVSQRKVNSISVELG